MIKQGRNYDMAIWLGLFAMLMIHIGPLISGTQALSSLHSDTDLAGQHLYERAMPATSPSSLESAAASPDNHLYERATPATAPSSLESATASPDNHLYERAMPATAFVPLASDTKHHQHAVMLVDESTYSQTQAEKTSDYHALMGHQPAPAGAPQWLANLEMCGYCDLLTVSPPLVLALLLALPVVPPVQWLAVLPAPPRPLPAVHSLRHPRAPPVHLFT